MLSEHETDRMMRMITDLLNLSRMDQSRLELDKGIREYERVGEHIANRQI